MLLRGRLGLEPFNSDYTPFLQAFDGVKEFAFLLSLQAEVLKHVRDWSAGSSEPSELISQIVDNKALDSPALPSCVSKQNGQCRDHSLSFNS